MPKPKDKPRRSRPATLRGRLLTIKEVAEFLRVSERSVLRYIEAGRLKASKVGWWRILQSDLDEFLKKTSNFKKIVKRNK